MTAITGQAASSGHITLLFSVQDDDVNLINQGSRGIGLCIDPDEPTCQITVTGKHGSGKISEQSQNENLVLQQTVINTLSHGLQQFRSRLGIIASRNDQKHVKGWT